MNKEVDKYEDVYYGDDSFTVPDLPYYEIGIYYNGARALKKPKILKRTITFEFLFDLCQIETKQRRSTQLDRHTQKLYQMKDKSRHLFETSKAFSYPKDIQIIQTFLLPRFGEVLNEEMGYLNYFKENSMDGNLKITYYRVREAGIHYLEYQMNKIYTKFEDERGELFWKKNITSKDLFKQYYYETKFHKEGFTYESIIEFIDRAKKHLNQSKPSKVISPDEWADKMIQQMQRTPEKNQEVLKDYQEYSKKMI